MTDDTADHTSEKSADSVTPEALYDRLRRGERVGLLDVRNREEAEAWRITGGDVERAQTPYSEFAAATARGEVADLAADLDLPEPVVAVCPRGEVSATVAERLRAEGVDARNLSDGMHGWARLYVARDLPADALPEGVAVVQYDRPASGCLSYLVVAGDEAAVIDPLRAFADRYAADAADRGATLRYAVDTHVHADHLSGVQALAGTDRAGVDAGSGIEAVLPAGADERGLAFDARLVGDGDELVVGDAALTAVHAPGHTTELTAFRLGDVLLSGDALFTDSFGRPDLEREAHGDSDGTSGEQVDPRDADGARDLAETLYDTLTDRLLALPDGVLVAPGHRRPDESPNPGENDAYAARVGAVRERLRLGDDRGAFAARVLDSLPPRPANYGDIVPANLGRESVDDETAFEMELGPNNCAVAAED
ncbi:MBL fold metallo-hydrolase [Halorussus halobius]|uniref:MBL fold metallo-hydrolase n=1 Tax=Halorussus halobius TaxID=1710537 RepID=UPI0010919BA6|nr:MBL fold metallo-hydrolase [Halorussus halobius]